MSKGKNATVMVEICDIYYEEVWYTTCITVGYYQNCTSTFMGYDETMDCYDDGLTGNDCLDYGVCTDEDMCLIYGECVPVETEEPEPEPDPCYMVAEQSSNADYKNKAADLKGKTGLKYESGFEEKKSGGYNALTNSGSDALHANPTNDTKGYIHNHVDDYEVDLDDGTREFRKPIKMFSPADVNTLMNIVDQNRNSGDFSDYYVSMVTSYGHYMLKFTGTVNDIKTGFGGDEWDKKYIEHMDGRGNLEKAFLQFLKNEMNVTGVGLFKIKNNGDVKSLELKPNGKSVEAKDC